MRLCLRLFGEPDGCGREYAALCRGTREELCRFRKTARACVLKIDPDRADKDGRELLSRVCIRSGGEDLDIVPTEACERIRGEYGKRAGLSEDRIQHAGKITREGLAEPIRGGDLRRIHRDGL